MVEKVIEVLKSLERTTSLNEKLRILKENYYNELLKKVFEYTYSSSYNFYITAPEDYKFYQPSEEINTPIARWEAWTELARLLYTRTVTGNLAKLNLKNFLTIVPLEERLWYIRIINRDLKIGISVDTLNKVWKKFIPTIDVQLADLYDPKKHMVFPKKAFVEPKIDGVRVIIFTFEDGIKVYSRNGERLGKLEPWLEKCKLPMNYVIDTEGFYNTWNSSLSIIQTGIGLEHLKLYAFDILTIKDYEHKTSKPLYDRKQDLANWIKNSDCKYIIEVPYYAVTSWAETKEYHQKFLDQNFEGAILKDANSKYEFKRSKGWLKIKKREYKTYLCVDVEEGMNKYKGKLGAFVVKSQDNTIFKVGSGLTDIQRKMYWENPPIGECLEVALEVSVSKISKASFPTFIRLRPDLHGKCW